MSLNKILFSLIILSSFASQAVFNIEDFIEDFEKENFEKKFKIFRRAKHIKYLKDKKDKRDEFRCFIKCSKNSNNHDK